MNSRHPMTAETPRRRGHGHLAVRLSAAAALAALAAGCATAQAMSPTAPTTHPSSPAPATSGSPVSPGTAKPDPPGTQTPDTPSAAALMVCSTEIGKDVASVMALPSPAHTTSTWSDDLYTCTYHLPAGALVLSVKQSPNTAAANTYFQALRQRWGNTQPLTGALGLGNPGYETPNGAVAILKDGKTLQVDATARPAASGPAQLSRTDLAYEIATDVIGCWNGN